MTQENVITTTFLEERHDENIFLYLNSITDENLEINEQLFDEFNNCKDFNEEYLFIKTLPDLDQFIEYIKEDEDKVKEFKRKIINIQFQKSIPLSFLKDNNLLELFDINEKLNLSFKHQYSRIFIKVNRENILWDSINQLKREHKKASKINVNYINEEGVDCGGLTRDWFTSICEAIKKTNVFIPVPNGSSLALNLNGYNSHIIEFTGKMIALALVNKISIPFRLTTSIWKYLLNEKVILEDMDDFDSQIYQSLKWISENDPEPLMMTFVNSNNQPLCHNGRRIKVNKTNSNRYVGLTLFDTLIKKYLHSLRIMKSGFDKIISSKRASMFLTSDDINKYLNGSEFIDVEDWANNVETREKDKDNVKRFFDVISKWPQEKLRKLLKFITGSSTAPVNGFKDYSKMGGNIKIYFYMEDKNRLPTSHTCFNQINLSNYPNDEILDQKLSIAIECDCFCFG